MTRLFKFQKQGVLRIEAFGGRALLADDQGLGKSIQALTCLQRNPDWLPAAVVCPAHLRWNWEREAKVHIGMPAQVLEGMTPPKLSRMLENTNQLTIASYSILGPWLPYLASLGLRTIIVDETLFVKSPKAKRTKNLRKLCDGVPHVIGLCGTPLVSRPSELWTILNIIDPVRYRYFRPFGMEFCGPKLTPWGTQYNGATNLDRLNRQLNRRLMIRRRKVDVLKDLPPKIRSVVPVPMDEPEEYYRAEADFIKWLRETQGDAKARKAKKAHRLVQMGYLKRLSGRLKLPAVGEYLDLFLQQTDEKRAVFAVHKDVIRWLHERYPDQSVVVDGSVSGRKRQLAFDQFLKGKRTRFLFGNVVAAGTGWSAKGVPNIDIIEPPWTPGECSQVEDRAYGIGRGAAGMPTRVSYFVARGTIEEKLLKIIQSKQDVLSRVLDNETSGQDLDVYTLLERELLKAHNPLGL